MAGDPTAAYRKQQGLAPITQSYDPKLVGWIVQAAKQTGADPAALLATSIQESGARLNGPAGDNGTSFGPFQFHVGGALANHSPAWANTYAAVLNRAQEFKRLQVHGGPGAAAVQRPLDRSLYARGVNSHLEQARAILAKNGAAPATPPSATQRRTPVTTSQSSEDLIGSSLLQSLINANAELAGISAPTLPVMRQPIPQTQPELPGKTTRPTTPAASPGKVIATDKFKLIGAPHQGTHTLGNWESDDAVDIAIPVGTPVYAPADGVIGSRIGALNSSNPRMAGLRVHLQTKGNELYYAHLSRLAVKAGQRVKKGQIIGYSGSANGVAHLHLATRSGGPRRYA